jgi:hypothetical protein
MSALVAAGVKAAMRSVFRPHEIGGECCKLVETIIRVHPLNGNGGPLDPAELPKLVRKSVIRGKLAKGAQSIPIRAILRIGSAAAADAKSQQRNQKDWHRNGKSSHSITVSPPFEQRPAT